MGTGVINIPTHNPASLGLKTQSHRENVEARLELFALGFVVMPSHCYFVNHFSRG